MRRKHTWRDERRKGRREREERRLSSERRGWCGKERYDLTKGKKDNIDMF